MLQGGFAHATASKVLTVVSLAGLLLENTEAQYGLGVLHAGHAEELWRVLTSQLVFSRTDGALFGALTFYHMRQVERQMGTSKFVGFAAFVTAIAALLQVQLLALFPAAFAEAGGPNGGGFATGPYALAFALVLLFWQWVPRRRRVVSTKVLGVPVTEKLMTYLFVSQCFLAGGVSSIVPSATAILPAALYLSGALPTDAIRTPDFVNATVSRVFAPLITTATGSNGRIRPNLTAQRQRQLQQQMRQRLGAGAVGVNAQGNYVPLGGNADEPRPGANAAAGAPQGGAAVPPPDHLLAPMPPDEKIQALMELGFDRDDVIAALRGADNNVEIAAGRLFSSRT